MKLFVNKKCNQISTDYGHTSLLINEILPYRDNEIFKEIFVHKLIDQGRVQVASHLESFKPLSYILFKLDNDAIISMYVRLMILKGSNEVELKGIYAIYFGYLNLKEDVKRCWFWAASVLNCLPNSRTGYVLEVFFFICGDMMHEKCGDGILKIIKYVQTYFLKELKNEAVGIRIDNILKKYICK